MYDLLIIFFGIFSSWAKTLGVYLALRCEVVSSLKWDVIFQDWALPCHVSFCCLMLWIMYYCCVFNLFMWGLVLFVRKVFWVFVARFGKIGVYWPPIEFLLLLLMKLYCLSKKKYDITWKKYKYDTNTQIIKYISQELINVMLLKGNY